MVGENETRQECAVTKELIDSAALYVYTRGYKKDDNPEELYNNWLSATGVRLESLSDAAMMLEKISGFLTVPYDDMEFALRYDNLI